MLRFISAHIPWNAISNLQLWQSFKALCGELVMPSASTLSNFCRREYSLTVDAIKHQLPSTNRVSLGLDGWTLTNKLAITSVIAYYMDQNRALREVQLTFDKVNSLLFSYFECLLRTIGQESTYWSKATHTFEGGSGSFRAYRRPFTGTYDRPCCFDSADDSGTIITLGDVGNQVACNETPHTVDGPHLSVCFGCVHEQSWCKDCTKSWEAHERDQQFGENEGTKSGKSETLRKEGNARINEVSAMRPVWQR